MLYTDSNHVTMAALRRLDPEIPDIEEAEQTLIDGADGIGVQAWVECGNRLLQSLRNVSSGLLLGGLNPVVSLGTPALRARINQVVVSETLRRWMLYEGARLFYRAVTSRKLSDRYQAKLDRAEADAARTWKLVKSEGVPICWKPLSRPGADHEFSGSWGSQNVTTTSGGTFTQQAISIAITWVDSTGNEAESDASYIQVVSVLDHQSVAIDISTLIPAGLRLPRPFGSYSGAMARTATGWNVYAGPADAPYLTLQNETPLSLNAGYVMTAPPTDTGAPLMNGQVPDVYVPIQNILPRS